MLLVEYGQILHANSKYGQISHATSGKPVATHVIVLMGKLPDWLGL